VSERRCIVCGDPLPPYCDRKRKMCRPPKRCAQERQVAWVRAYANSPKGAARWLLRELRRAL